MNGCRSFELLPHHSDEGVPSLHHEAPAKVEQTVGVKHIAITCPVFIVDHTHETRFELQNSLVIKQHLQFVIHRCAL